MNQFIKIKGNKILNFSGLFSTQINTREAINNTSNKINSTRAIWKDATFNLSNNLHNKIPIYYKNEISKSGIQDETKIPSLFINSKSKIFLYGRESSNKEKYDKTMKYARKLFEIDKNSISQLRDNNPQSISKKFNFKPQNIVKKTNNLFNNTKRLFHTKSDFLFGKSSKRPFDGFMSFNVPRITTQMRKSASDCLPKNVITKYHKTMEVSLKTGEKQFGKVNLEKRERYNNIKGICDKSNKKISNILKSEKIKNIKKLSNQLPKIKDFSLKKHRVNLNIYEAGVGKHMGFKYDPNDLYYPTHKIMKRSDTGHPYLY